MIKEIKGWHVLSMFVLGFGVIVSVNAVLAINAVRGFPGLETPNSYVASQQFDAARAAQLALNWEVSTVLVGDQLTLEITQDGVPVAATITAAIFGRPTSVAHDQYPDFILQNGVFTAEVEGGPGQWNLRLWAEAPDGTAFQQRIVIEAAG